MIDNWTDLQGTEISPFIEAYRQALQEQKTASEAQLEQERTNAQAGIMSGANTRGLLYSNFPAHQKIQYDTNTYYPSLAKINTNYITGLDTLRNNAASYYNQIEEMKKNIANLNKLYT